LRLLKTERRQVRPEAHFPVIPASCAAPLDFGGPARYMPSVTFGDYGDKRRVE